jgi:hypothetical protein
VRFVDDDVVETKLLEGGLLDEADLVATDAYFEVLRDESVRNNVCALLLCASKDAEIDDWSPLFELAGLILECRFGDDNEMPARNAEIIPQVDCLKAFTKTLKRH